MKIHGMALLRNEAGKDRWIDDFLTQLNLICDRIVILDDCSTDETVSICKKYNCEVHQTEKQLWNNNEVLARKLLFNYTCNKANNNDWILCLDGDELIDLAHIGYIDWVFKHYNKYALDSIGFRLFDMWDDENYRDDINWSAHLRHWIMAIKLYKGFNYQWSNKKLHCGRFPINSCKSMLPTNIPIKHMGWSKEKFRIEKYNRYMSIDGNGEYGVIDQYKSILDKNPKLWRY